MPSTDNKRRLPVLKSAPEEPGDDAEDRPPWHWIGFGTVGIFGAWLPLMAVAQKLSDTLVLRAVGHVGSAEDAARSLANASAQDRLRVGLMLAVPHGLALACASVAGGYLVGRFGKGLGPREAAIAGVALGIVIGGLTFGVVGVAGFLAPLALATPFAALGGALGRRKARAAG
ncbi:MAG TPA: hypothetical protein PLR99_00920 [Polyangiaceae bacterium]|nr:hypothetical protein [Polyangiaceae bacterium]